MDKSPYHLYFKLIEFNSDFTTFSREITSIFERNEQNVVVSKFILENMVVIEIWLPSQISGFLIGIDPRIKKTYPPVSGPPESHHVGKLLL